MSCAVVDGVIQGGCDAGTTDASFCLSDGACSSAGGPASGCTTASLGCPDGSAGYACPPEENPGRDDVTLTCSTATTSGSLYDYCCRPWPSGNACVRDPEFPCGFNAYALQCSPGANPATIDPGLQCGEGFSQSNGDDVFCCTGL